MHINLSLKLISATLIQQNSIASTNTYSPTNIICHRHTGWKLADCQVHISINLKFPTRVWLHSASTMHGRNTAAKEAPFQPLSLLVWSHIFHILLAVCVCFRLSEPVKILNMKCSSLAMPAGSSQQGGSPCRPMGHSLPFHSVTNTANPVKVLHEPFSH